MLDLLKKLAALVPVGHELYEAIHALFKELCERIQASDNSVRETREMLAARADQVGELTTRLALVERMERVPELAKSIKDVRIDSLEDRIGSLAARLEQLDRDPSVRFVRAELAPPANADGPPDDTQVVPPPALAAAEAPQRVQCAFHPHAPMDGEHCLFPECTWPGIDSAA